MTDLSELKAARLCVLSAPETATELAEELVRDLPGLVDRDVCGRLCNTDGSLGAETSVAEIAEIASALMQRQRCDGVLCLTDVPLRVGDRPLIAASNPSEGVAIISIPAFGMTRLRPRVREAAVRLIDEMLDPDREHASDRPLTRPRLGDMPTPIRRVWAPETRLPVQYVIPPALGHLRLLSGMVRANRPWRAMAGLSSAVVAAVATGAFAVLNSVVWMLSVALSPLRLAGIMLAAVAAIVVYLVLSHNLWHKPHDQQTSKDAALYNAATVLTLLAAVVCAYVVLFIALLLATALIVDAHTFRSEASHPVNLTTYLRLAWLSASFATVAGALGSGLESVAEVRQAAYGHNQRERKR